MVVEWQTKLHDKEQEIKIMQDKYEKQMKSMSAELEEQDASLEQFRETIQELNQRCTLLTDELEDVSTKKKKYLQDKDKLLKVVERLELEK